ncbi:MAG: flagellar hook assembly protein FlgD [Syntrophales bacterium]|nr:flagellar hook assembly protein FlgD [Syntrophales bacterium]
MATVDSVTGNAHQYGSEGTSVLGKNDFLNMLVAQLQNQDPLNPMNGEDFTAQLAQFSSLEQLSNVNDNMESLLLYNNVLCNYESVGLIGKEITAKGSQIVVDGGSADIIYNLPEDAREVTIEIYDMAGDRVDTLEYESQASGVNTVSWDCSDREKGVYSFSVSAKNSEEESLAVETMLVGIVDGVNFKGSQTYLSVDGQDILIGDVISVKGMGVTALNL